MLHRGNTLARLLGAQHALFAECDLEPDEKALQDKLQAASAQVAMVPAEQASSVADAADVTGGGRTPEAMYVHEMRGHSFDARDIVAGAGPRHAYHDVLEAEGAAKDSAVAAREVPPPPVVR